MNKKLIALAVAGAFAAPVAMADTGNVKISGTLDMSIDNVDGNTNTTAPVTDNGRQWGVSSNASNVVLSGDEDLGNGTSAVWQLQTFVNFGGTGASSFTDGSTYGALSNGVSYVGLSSKSWGSVLVGKQDSSMKLLGRKVDLFGNRLGDSRNLIQKYGSTADWDARPTNTVLYATPDMSGFKAYIHYTTNADSSYTKENSTTVTGVAGMYENGPVFAGLAYQKNSIRATPNSADPSAWRLAGGYNLGDFKLVALYEQTKDNSAVAGTDDDRKVWGLGGAYKRGSNTLKLQYYKAGQYGNVANTDANMWALGVDHAMSKRTTAYVGYARTSNDSGVGYSMSGGGHDDNYGTVSGKDPSGFQVGLVHKF